MQDCTTTVTSSVTTATTTAGATDDVSTYFDEAILKSVRGDIQALLSTEPVNPYSGWPVAGALLAVVTTGIDTLGGMIYDFTDSTGRPNSGDRSKAFMQEQMGLSVRAAQIIYVAGRCGFLHESAPKARVGIRFDSRVNDRVLFHTLDADGGYYVHLEVVELARRFLETVEKIAKDKSVLKHLPDAAWKNEAGKTQWDETIDALLKYEARPHPDRKTTATTTAP